MPYGYDPLQFVQKDRTGIGQASQILAGTIAGMPEKIRAKEDRQKAIDAANANWNDMEAAYKAVMHKYVNAVSPLAQQGLITDEEITNNLNELTAPTSVDKKDPGAYIQNTGIKLRELFADIKQRQVSSGVGQAIQGRIPGETTEGEPVAGVPGAETQQQIAQSQFLPQGTSMEQLEKDPGFATAQTQAQEQKQEIAGAKLEQQKAKDIRMVAAKEYANSIQERSLQLRQAQHQLDIDEFELGKFEGREKGLLADQKNTLTELGQLKEALPFAKEPVIKADIEAKIVYAERFIDEIKGSLDWVRLKIKGAGKFKKEGAVLKPAGGQVGEPAETTKLYQDLAAAQKLLAKKDFATYSAQELTQIIEAINNKLFNVQ